ncbi:hypothetical protein CAPTEDRAFT_72490, partial [Capitella teleta]
EILRINVGGSMFMTSRSSLDRIPGTRLSNLTESDANYNPVTEEWFFDRNPMFFNNILDYFRSDDLHFPHNYCGPSIKKELQYWKIKEGEISPCCWNKYREYEEEQNIYKKIESAFESKTLNEYQAAFNSQGGANPTRWQTWRRRMCVFLEEPMSSKPAQVWTFMFLVFVLASIGVLCIETHPSLRVPLNSTTPKWIIERDSIPRSEQNPKIFWIVHTQPHKALETVDSICTSFFTLEFFLRWLVAPNRFKFWKSPMNIIDVLCVLPMWIRYIMQLYHVQIDRSLLPVFFVLMMLRVLRICRVLRMARHYTGVKILVLALNASFKELGMLVIFIFIVVLIFAVVIYYAEFFVSDTFLNIPAGWWWAIITITTVGYGDAYPKSWLGYLVGALCAITGILATGLPVPIIANNFNLYYRHAQMKYAVDNRKNRN